ncbi:Hsp70 family protein [uncultured Tateyamaria sp.]|uniref:Hsp70 family protein n=1 Tax=uncultured Tateyamaria sp. TaxID=455651 RepID=UPI0026100A1E|nr:Hsp70 family protein [uncultured Tateyamaria sp.]
MAVLGVDFGTSNSAVGMCVNGTAKLIPLEPGALTLPTAVFFDFEARKRVYGSAANSALIAGDEGRYMRALKSLLGTSLMRERRNLLNESIDFITIVGRFLAEMKGRAEAATGLQFDQALSGRPVLFHSGDPRRNAQALVDLKECYQAAGFKEVSFMAEPEAAALAIRAALQPGDLGLVVDIGGGTSDFTLFRQGSDAGIDILASHGLRLGGTNFDRALSLAFVMPELGMGSSIRHAFGDQTHVAPNAIFHDLATWQKIPFLYTQDTRRAARELAQYAEDRVRLNRLVRVLEEEMGHDMAFAVEAAKIEANTGAAAVPEIDLKMVAPNLRVPLYPVAMTATLSEMAGKIADAAEETLAQAGVEPDAVDRLIFVGGSSLMQVVETALTGRLPRAKVHRGAALTAIVEGLALAAGDGF